MDEHTQNVMFGRESDEWETPEDLFTPLYREFGFTLDGAASTENHKLPRWNGSGGERDDALAFRDSWGTDIVFLNPPYSKVTMFMDKVIHTRSLGGIIVALLPNRSSEKWFDAVWQADEVRVLRGRVSFLRPGKRRCSAPFGSIVAVYDGLKPIFGQGPRWVQWRWRE